MSPADTGHRVARQKWRESVDHADRPNPGAASPMRDAKSLVEIQMTNIRADVTGSAKTDLSVHICAVHVDQTPGGMDFRAHCFDGFLKDAVE